MKPNLGKSIFISSLILMLGPSVFAKLIEDGSSFTGAAIVQEKSCEKKEFSYLTGDTVLDPNFNFEGTPQGLMIDGNLIPISPLKMFDHGDGIETGGYAMYKSSHKFVTEVVEIDPLLNNGQKTVTVDDYMENPNGDLGEIVETETVAIGNGSPTVTSVCHFIKVSPSR